MRRTFVAVLLCMTLSSGCAGEDSTSDRPRSLVPTRQLTLTIPDFMTSGLAWPDPDSLIVTNLPASWDGSQPLRERAMTIDPRDASAGTFVSGSNPMCDIVDYLYPTSLSDGRVGLLHRCERYDVVSESLMAIAPRDSHQEVLAQIEPDIVTGLTWDSARDRGLVTSDQWICAGIALVTPKGIEPLPVLVAQDDRAFRVDEDFRRGATDDCRDYGLASWPALAPNGDVAAFFASPESVGVGGLEKPEMSWNLYLLGMDELDVRQTLHDVRFPRSPAWSPDGQWIAFAGEVGSRGSGIWLLRPSDATLKRVTTYSRAWIAWSPDGTHLAAASQRLEILDVRRLLA